MQPQIKKAIIHKIQHYSEKVNGFKPRKINIQYWESLDDYTLMRVYKKWQDLYSAVIFTDLPWKED